jgi:exodeoxyribonuclease V beta subunit
MSALHQDLTLEAQRPLALSFPLRGSQLIEASAGTGKTFTISALYLRLILGHGGADSGFGRELLPPQILVVTFTDAATQELRDRIRQRLTEAARFFRDEIAAPDALLERLRDDYDPAHWPGCASRLEVAAQWMDEAAVSTIHSWCQRMLREHAFDSGSLFTQTLETDHSELLGEVLRDYWRRFCYGMQGDTLEGTERARARAPDRNHAARTPAGPGRTQGALGAVVAGAARTVPARPGGQGGAWQQGAGALVRTLVR